MAASHSIASRVVRRCRGSGCRLDLQALAKSQLQRVTVEMSARCLADVRTLDDWNRQRAQRRRELLDMLGLDPLPTRTPLKAQITGTLERPAYRRREVVFQSLPGLYVTGNFYVPKEARNRADDSLFVRAFAASAGSEVSVSGPRHWFAAHGYACSCSTRLNSPRLQALITAPTT